MTLTSPAARIVAIAEALSTGAHLDDDALNLELERINPAPEANRISVIRAAVEAVAAKHQSWAKRSGSTIAEANARPLVATVRRALAETGWTFDQADELATAQERLDSLHDERQRVVQAFAEAVERVDVEEVAALRTRLELELPGETDAAELSIFDLKIAEANSRAVIPRSLIDERKAEKTAAEERVQRAQSALDEAQSLAENAGRDLRYTQQDAQAYELAVSQLHQDRATLAGEIEARRARRVAHLLGTTALDESDTGNTAAPTEPELVEINPPRHVTRAAETVDLGGDTEESPVIVIEPMRGSHGTMASVGGQR